jgi:type II secretory pathway pseudopilin PulG
MAENRIERGQPVAADVGATLVEVLVAIVLMGMVAVSILPAMWTSVKVARFSDGQAQVEAVLGAAVDKVANQPWMACPTQSAGTGYQARARAAASIYEWPDTSVNVARILYWDVTTKSWSTTNPVAADCGNAQTTLSKERTLQLVTIEVTHPEGRISNTVDLVMGDLRTEETT